MEEFVVKTTTMTSTSLAALHMSYGLKPCRVILERLEGLEPSQHPGPVTPRQASKARTKAPKFRYGRSRTGSSRLRKKRSKTPLKIVIRPQHRPRYPGNNDVTSEEPPTEKELSDVTVTTCQPSDGAEAPKDGSSRAERSGPRGRRNLTPGSREWPLSEIVSRGPGDENEEEKEACDPVVATPQPSEIAAKAPRKRRSLTPHSHPRKVQALTPSLQVCARPDKLVSDRVDETGKDKETGDQVMATQSSEIGTGEPGRATGSRSRKKHSLTPASQVCACLEEFPSDRVDGSEKRGAGNQASTTRQVRRKSTPKWRHGVIRRRRPRKKLKFTTTASGVCGGHSEQLFVDPVDKSALLSTSESPAEEELGGQPLAERRGERTMEMELGGPPGEEEPPTETGSGNQPKEHDDQARTLEPPGDEGFRGRHAAEEPRHETMETDLGDQPGEKEPPAQQCTERGDEPAAKNHHAVETSQEPQAKAVSPSRRSSGRQRGSRVARARGQGRQRRRGGLPAAHDTDGAQATAGMVDLLPPAEEGLPLLPVQETSSLCGTYVEESVTTISLDDTTVDHTTMLVPIGGEQWAVISGEVVEPKPSKELYVERQDFSPRAPTTKGRRKRRRKSFLTPPRKRGRPPKNTPAEPRKRGRPRKDASATPPVEPRKRGRPRKDASATPPVIKRGGRQRKNALEAPKRRGQPLKNPRQAPKGRGRRGRQPKNTPSPSSDKRRPGRPRKSQVVAWIDPCAQQQDHGLVSWLWPLPQEDDCDAKSDWETCSNVSDAYSINQGFPFPEEDNPEPEKKKPRKRRGTRKKTTAGPPKKRGRPRKNPLPAASSSQGTSSARGRASRRKMPGPFEEEPSLTLASFQDHSPASVYYPDDEDDEKSDWETCSNFSSVTVDGNSHLEDMLLPDVDWPGPSRYERAGAPQDAEPSHRCNGLRSNSPTYPSDDEASSTGGDQWETASHVSSDWNPEIGAMLLPPGRDVDGSGKYIVTEPDDQIVTYQELAAAAPPHRPSPSRLPVLLTSSMVTEGSPAEYTVTEPPDEEQGSEASSVVATDREPRYVRSPDVMEPSSVLSGGGGSDGELVVVTLSSDDSDWAGSNGPGSESSSIVSNSRTENSGLEMPEMPGICTTGSPEPEVIDISDDSDLEDGKLTSFAAVNVEKGESTAGGKALACIA